MFPLWLQPWRSWEDSQGSTVSQKNLRFPPNYSLQLTLQTYYFMKLMVGGSEIVASFVAGGRHLMRTL